MCADINVTLLKITVVDKNKIEINITNVNNGLYVYFNKENLKK